MEKRLPCVYSNGLTSFIFLLEFRMILPVFLLIFLVHSLVTTWPVIAFISFSHVCLLVDKSGLVVLHPDFETSSTKSKIEGQHITALVRQRDTCLGCKLLSVFQSLSMQQKRIRYDPESLLSTIFDCI